MTTRTPIKKATERPEHTETQIQRAAMDYLETLRLHGQPLCFVRTNAAGPGKRRGFKANLGMPDIMGVAYGVAVGFEMKRPGKDLEEDQVKFKTKWEKAGGMYFQIDSLDELEHALAVIKI